MAATTCQSMTTAGTASSVTTTTSTQPVRARSAHWGGNDYDDIVFLQQDVHLFDLHSIGTSAANPTFPYARILQIFRPTIITPPPSPVGSAIEPNRRWRRRRALDAPPAPGSRNLLTNGSFEVGTASWTVSVGGGTQSANPEGFAFGGTRYFAPGTVAAGFAEQTVNLTSASAGFTGAA